jgi:hypothetical protein
VASEPSSVYCVRAVWLGDARFSNFLWKFRYFLKKNKKKKKRKKKKRKGHNSVWQVTGGLIRLQSEPDYSKLKPCIFVSGLQVVSKIVNPNFTSGFEAGTIFCWLSLNILRIREHYHTLFQLTKPALVSLFRVCTRH